MEIFGIGTVVVDHVIELPHFPAEDTKVEVANAWNQVGGPVPVALSAAAFYGAETGFLGRWGNDAAGINIHQTLRDRGIDLSNCSSADDWASGFAHVWVDSSTGSRTIAYSRGDFPVPNEHDVNDAMLSDIRILHLDGWAGDAAIKAATIVKRNGGTVVLDAGSVKPRMDELLPLVDVVIASKLFRESQFGNLEPTAEQLLSLGPPNVITTDGASGATWITSGSVVQEPAIRIEAVDTNGAGDIFCGCILHALRLQKTRREALQFANNVAGYACTQQGNYSLPE